MTARDGGVNSQPPAPHAQAQSVRRQAQVLVRHRAARRATAEVVQRLQAAADRAEQIHQRWLAACPAADRLRYSAYARLQAQLASMPVIEQAKGIIMAQCGWPADQAFDALRRASQRENIKVRDLAAQIVAATAQPGTAPPHPPAANRTCATTAKRGRRDPRRASRDICEITPGPPGHADAARAEEQAASVPCGTARLDLRRDRACWEVWSTSPGPRQTVSGRSTSGWTPSARGFTNSGKDIGTP